MSLARLARAAAATLLSLAALVAAVTGTAGCARSPRPLGSGPRSTSHPVSHGGAHPHPHPRSTALATRGGRGRVPASPAPLIRGFAERYINWTWHDVAADMAQLALASRGEARSALAMAAVETHGDVELRQEQIANTGTVESVAAIIGETGRWVVVTLERTTAMNSAAYEGLAPAWHVAVATVTPTRAGGWVISGWQPES